MDSAKKTTKDIIKVLIGNIFKLAAGLVIGFLLPKIVGVTDYGYYKTFTLYATYVGLLHFGFVDGIYLKYGGKEYSELDKSLFRMFTSLLIAIELIVSIIMAMISVFALPGELQFIFLCLAVYTFATNVTNYFQIISQITGRFNEFSLRTIIQAALTIVSIIALWIVHKVSGNLLSYRIYTIIYTSIMVVLTMWYVITYRDITFGSQSKFKVNRKLFFSLFLLGFPLMISNLCSSLILSLDRQFVNILFDMDTYAIYAFAYNMLSLISIALTAISTVLYPSLKKMDLETLKSKYTGYVKIILIVVFICLMLYFPLCAFVSWFLPNYVGSLIIFRIILPGLAISSVITIVMQNYYKAEGKVISFFIKTVIILGISCLANYIAYRIFVNTVSISAASVITMVLWYVLMEEYFIRKHKVKWIQNFLYMLCVISAFYGITFLNIWWAEMLIYIAALSSLTYLFYFKSINEWIRMKREKH